MDKLNRITRTVHEEARSYRGFKFFHQEDEALFLTLVRGEFTISGLQNKHCALGFLSTAAAKCPGFSADCALTV